MFEFLTASQNMPFVIALSVMFGIAILEGITSLLGLGLSSVIESLMPEVGSDVEIASPEYQSPTPLSRLLGWLRIGQVPVLMLLVVFLTGFGLMGLGLQSLANSFLGTLLPALIAVIPAVFLALSVVRMFGGVLDKIMPQDETEAVSEASLLGRVATITLGTAKAGSPAEAKVQDSHGATHYLMVEPDIAGEVFEAKSSVLLVRQEGAVFKAIINPNASLVDAGEK